MGLELLFVAGVLVALSLMFHAFKMVIKRVLGYDLYLDLFLSIALMIMFHGTQGGMMVALFGGLIISASLRILRWTIGYQRLGVYHQTYKVAIFEVKLPRVVWFEYPPISKLRAGAKPYPML